MISDGHDAFISNTKTTTATVRINGDKKTDLNQRGLVFNGVIVANIGLVQPQAQEQNAQSGNGLQEYDTADVFRREVP